MCWHVVGEVVDFDGEVFFHIGGCVGDIHIATSLVDSANSFVVGEEFLQDGLVGDC